MHRPSPWDNIGQGFALRGHVDKAALPLLFIFWRSRLLFFFFFPFIWEEELSYAACFASSTAQTDAGCQAGVLTGFVCGFLIGAKQETRVLQGCGRHCRQPGNPTAGYPWGGGCSRDAAVPHHWQPPPAGKSLRMRQEGWGKGKAQADGGGKWGLRFQGQIIQLSVWYNPTYIWHSSSLSRCC